MGSGRSDRHSRQKKGKGKDSNAGGSDDATPPAPPPPPPPVAGTANGKAYSKATPADILAEFAARITAANNSGDLMRAFVLQQDEKMFRNYLDPKGMGILSDKHKNPDRGTGPEQSKKDKKAAMAYADKHLTEDWTKYAY